MSEDPTTQLVEITFVGTAPTRQIEWASGVTDVEIDGQTVRCRVSGSFQPFLEAIRGYEVIGLSAIPAVDATQAERQEEGRPRR